MNTTFTTYAEKKAKQFLNLLQGYTKGIRITAILILLLMGVNNAWADITFTGGYIYFDNSIGINQKYIQLCARQSSWTGVSTMTNISNTKLYYVANPQGSSWGGILGWVVIGNSTAKTNSNFDNWSAYGWCSNWNTFDFYSGSTYLIVPTSTSKSQSVNTSYYSGGFNDLNSEQTIKTVVDGVVANSKATISITSYKMTGNGTATEQTATLGTGAKDSYITAARTATTTLTVGTVATGYQFDGWYTEATGGTQLSTDETYTYYPTAATTVYARFSTKQHTVKFGVHSSGNGTITAKVGSTSISSGDKVNYGSTIEFTATPSTGYQIEGWYSNSACTTPIDNGTNKTYTVTITGGTNVYVKFVEIPVNSHNITYTAQGTGWTYGAKPTSAEEGATVTFVVNPTAGYSVSVSSDGPALTGPNANNQYTFTMPTKDVKITVEAEPEQYTVTLNKQSGTGGTSSVTATYAAALPTITPPTRTGYTFNGYFDATSGGTKYYDANGNSAKNWDKTSNTTLYAQWTANQYTITYKDQGNVAFSGTHTSTPPTKHTYGTATTLKTATKTGYTFDGWFTTSACTGTAITSLGATDYTSNITLYAKWTEIPPTTIYIRSNGSYADFKWNYNSVAYDMEKVDCDGTYYTADILGGVEEITLTGSNSFTTTTLTVPTDDKKLYDLTSTTHLYLKPNSNWKADGARFAAAFLNNDKSTTEWVSMDSHDADTYKCAIPDGTWKYVIFCRMNGSKPENNWDNKWNQTGDLTIPTDGKNLFDKPNGTWDGATTSWSAIYDNNRWTTFDAPQLDVTIHITGKGSIVINGETYTSDSKGTKSFTISKAINETITVGDITPAERWAYKKDAKIEMCDEEKDLATSHTITGPAVITLSFTQESYEVVFNLGIPKGVPIPNWTINNQYIAHGDTVVKPTVGEINGYLFGGWYTTGEYSDATLYNFGTPVTKDIVLHARWVPYEQCIFFKNNPHWDNVYVYTFTSDAWENNKGVHAKGRYNEYGKMTQIGKTDIYYYILTDLTGFRYIAFSNIDMSSYDEFHQANAIYRGDRQDQMQLFIPQSDQTPTTTNNTQYYSSGLWIKYNNTYSGYDWSGKTAESDWSDTKLTTANPGGYSFTAEVILNAGTAYQFKIKNVNGSWYGYNGTMTSEDCTNLLFETDTDNAKIHPTVSGTYEFTVHLGEGKVLVSLEYPLVEGDYRLAYSDDSTGFHPGHYIKQNTKAEEKSDTVSFFVHHKKDPKIWVQQCTEIDDQGNETWETIATYSATSVTSDSDHPNNAMLPGRKNTGANITIGTTGCNITETGVFNFVLKQTNENSTHKVSLDTEATHKYKGNFYIRTDATAGGWKAFRAESNQMNYSTYADAHENFSHYFCEWITVGRNVKFTIANDYSYCISDTLDNDAIIESNDHSIGCLPADANVRFGWDYKTNLITRAYLRGSTYKEHPFLLLQGNEHLTDANGDKLEAGTNGSDRYGLKENEEIFGDLNNWVYQTDVTANQNTLIKLVAEYNGTKQYFKGSAEEYTHLLTSTSNQSFKIRLMYDFKTNHLVIAWLPESEITTDFELGSDMMIIRRNQENAMQVHFNPNSKQVSGIGTGYAVMTFDKYFLNNRNPENESLLPENERKSNYERALYWVSFPFDVRLKEVFGFGEYGQHWIMEYYDGDARAANGLWADSDTYWKYITNPDYTLKAGQGYVLCLNLGKMEYEDDIFDHDVKEVSLYFPSASPLQTITGEVTTAIVTAHTCTIKRDNRNIYDSNWNLIGVPGFKDITGVGVGGSAHDTIVDANVTEKCLNFYYKYIPKDNKYEATDNTSKNDFQTMFSYMVQFAGTIEWSSPAFKAPSSVAARRAGEMPSEHTLRLEFLQSETLADQTIIKLQEKDATADFDMNIDMAKMMNSGTNIYTMTANTNIMVGGNALPIARTTVPVGVRVDATGEYTFRMPDGTDGISVILLDNQTGAHINMLYDEYTVTLDAGTYENRFSLSVDPNRSATSVENIFGDDNEENGDKATGVKKFIIDGQLFIRTANGLFDAKGQRL